MSLCDDSSQLQLLLQWAQHHDEAERALTDDNEPFMDHRPTGDSPGEQLPTGQPDLHAEQAHMLGLNDSSAGGPMQGCKHSCQACRASLHARAKQ